MLGTVVAKHYEIINPIAKGPLYDVYRARHLHNHTLVAVKIESRSMSESKILAEAKILKELRGE